LCNPGSHLGAAKFEEVSDRVGAENYWPWGLSVGDLNADGWDGFIASGMNFPYRYGINFSYSTIADKSLSTPNPFWASSRAAEARRTLPGSISIA